MSNPAPNAGMVYVLLGLLLLLITTVAAAQNSGAVLVWLILGLAFVALGLALDYRRV